MQKLDVLIVGAGPGGITLGSKLKEAGFNVACFDNGAPGGKINIAPRVDNYAPYKEIYGPDLAFEFFNQAQKAHLPIIGEKVLKVEKINNIFKIKTNYNEYESKIVVSASGTNERKLGIEKEDHFFTHGLSYCALCDGHFYKNEDVAVIGGGNSAFKEAIYLSKICKIVYLIHRRNEFRSEINYVNELKEKKNVIFLTPYVLDELLGEDKISGLSLKNVDNGEIKKIDVKAVFPLVGQIPNTDYLPNEILDEYKNVIVNEDMMTNIDGLFALGDVIARIEKQIYLAVNDANKAYKKIISMLD